MTLTRLPQNVWNAPKLRQRMEDEAGFECSWGIPDRKLYWISVPESDTLRGNIELRNFEPSLINFDPHDHQKGMALQLRQALQKEISFDGVWIVGWTHPPSVDSAIRIDGDNAWNRLIVAWLDKDADWQFTCEFDSPLWEMVQNGIVYYLEAIENSWHQWDENFGRKALKHNFEIKESEQKAATLESMN